MEEILHHFELEGVTKSQNSWDRIHWAKRMEDKQLWFWLVKAAIGHEIPSCNEARRVLIVRVGKRLIDDCNCPSGAKYIVDALVEFGQLKDDSRKWARILFDQRKCGADETPHMEITISREVTSPSSPHHQLRKRQPSA